MATVFSDWIGESTPTTGNGDIILGGSLQGFAPMAAAGLGDIYYTIVDGQNKETGLGHYNGSTGFSRTTVIATLVDGIHTPSGAPLDLSGSAQIYGTVNSGTMKDIYDRLASGDADTDEIYIYIDDQISDVNQAITDLSNQVNGRIDNLGPDDVGAYPRSGGDLTGKAIFKNSDSGIHIDGGNAAAGTAGDFRYNPTLGLFEGYFNGKWRNVGGGTGVVWAPTAASVNPAEVGKGYLINAAGLTITLPAAPEAGNSIGIGDYNGQNFTATVNRNGKPIMGVAEDFTFNVKNANIVLSFVDNTIGWVLTQGFGESSVPMAIMNKSAPAVTVGQTVFSFPNFGTDSVDVYYNGKKLLRNSDYIANNVANTVTLAVGVSLADDIVELYNWNQAAVVQANKISYDNTVSGLTATTMQQAIDQSFNRKNILGPVSQSSGVPTGAIIETITNANGTAIKYADGTMICHFIASMNAGAAIAVGPFFKSTTTYNWTFPVAFALPPSFSVVGYWTDAAYTDAQSWTIFERGPALTATTSPRMRIMSTASWANMGFALYLQAIGRWY